MRLLSIAVGLRRTASEIRRPVALQTVRITRCFRLATVPRKRATSSRLSTTGSFFACRPVGMSSSMIHGRLRVTA